MKIPRLVEVFVVSEQPTPPPGWGIHGPAVPGSLHNLYDDFSKDFPEFKRKIEKEAEKYLGKDFKDVIDRHAGKPGATDTGIKKAWDNNFTDHEALGEVGFWYDAAQQQRGYGSPLDPQGSVNRPNPYYNGHNFVPRPGRPIGVDGNGDLIWSSDPHSRVAVNRSGARYFKKFGSAKP